MDYRTFAFVAVLLVSAAPVQIVFGFVSSPSIGGSKFIITPPSLTTATKSLFGVPASSFVTTTSTIRSSPTTRTRTYVVATPTTPTVSDNKNTNDAVVTESKTNKDTKSKPREHYDSIIAGGGPAGLLTAIMLTQKYGPSHTIAVCERLPDVPKSPTDDDAWTDVARFYLLGIGFRGQRALKKFGVFEDFMSASVEVQGRRDWQPGQTRPEDGTITPAQKDVTTQVLARDKLVGVLYHHLVQNYIIKNNAPATATNSAATATRGGGAQIDFLYGYEVEPIQFGNEENNDNNNGSSSINPVKVRITKCEGINAGEDECELSDEEPVYYSTTQLLIGSDGAARKVANMMERFDKEKKSQQPGKPFRVKRFHDDNPRLFKSTPIQLPTDWPSNLNYSARSSNNRITLEALPSNNDGLLCALLLLKPEDEFAKAECDPNILRQYFEKEFPQFSVLINDDEMDRLAKKPATSLPSFRYAGPRLNYGKRTLILGDAAHTVKPYYGLGCNTALEDVEILSDTLDECINDNDVVDPITKAVPLFSDRRAGDSKALVTMSRNMDRPGKMFLVTFLIPIILDGIFHKLAPKVFAPNMFAMFQKQDIGFEQIAKKKRLDRILQVSIIATGVSIFGWSIQWTIAQFAQAIGKSSKTVSLGLLAMGIVAGLFQKVVVGKNKGTKLNKV